MVACNRGNSHYGRKLGHGDFAITILPELPGCDTIKAPGMGMSHKAKGAFQGMHEREMGFEFLFPGVEALAET